MAMICSCLPQLTTLLRWSSPLDQSLLADYLPHSPNKQMVLLYLVNFLRPAHVRGANIYILKTREFEEVNTLYVSISSVNTGVPIINFINKSVTLCAAVSAFWTESVTKAYLNSYLRFSFKNWTRQILFMRPKDNLVDWEKSNSNATPNHDLYYGKVPQHLRVSSLFWCSTELH